MTPAQRRTHCQQIGTLGGSATVARRSPQWMRTIGALGFARYAQLHHDGNRASARAALMESKPKTFSRRM